MPICVNCFIFMTNINIVGVWKLDHITIDNTFNHPFNNASNIQYIFISTQMSSNYSQINILDSNKIMCTF